MFISGVPIFLFFKDDGMINSNQSNSTKNTELLSILKIKDTQNIYSIIKKGLELIGEPKLSQDDIVIIKPNLCAIRTSETGCTTDPRVVEGVIGYLKNELGVSNIFIVESDGTQVNADMAFKLLGYKRLSRRLNVRLVNLSKSPCSIKEFPNNIFLKKIKMPKVMRKANFFISVPKIKTHDMCSFTAVLKNQYGCNPYPRKTIYHKRLHDAIVDLNVAFKPDLIIVDGIVAMEGRGPVDGIPVKMNTIIFGRDPVATDHLIARIMGINPDGVKYIREAKRRGVGTDNYEIRGRSLAEVRRKFRDRPRRRNLYGLFCF